MTIICDQGNRTEPRGKRREKEVDHPKHGSAEKSFPARLERLGQERVGLENAFVKLLKKREDQDDAKHHEERKLEAGLKKLSRFPDQNDERGGEERIDEVDRAVDNPAAEHHQRHDNSADGRSGPAGHSGIEKQKWRGQQGAISARNAKRAHQSEKNSRDDGDSEAIDGENVVRCRLNERFGDLVGENGFPAERERPFEKERFILGGKSHRDGAASPRAKAIGERR